MSLVHCTKVDSCLPANAALGFNLRAILLSYLLVPNKFCVFGSGHPSVMHHESCFYSDDKIFLVVLISDQFVFVSFVTFCFSNIIFIISTLCMLFLI